MYREYVQAELGRAICAQPVSGLVQFDSDPLPHVGLHWLAVLGEAVGGDQSIE